MHTDPLSEEEPCTQLPALPLSGSSCLSAKVFGAGRWGLAGHKGENMSPKGSSQPCCEPGFSVPIKLRLNMQTELLLGHQEVVEKITYAE